jgi:hypothetical protein
MLPSRWVSRENRAAGCPVGVDRDACVSEARSELDSAGLRGVLGPRNRSGRRRRAAPSVGLPKEGRKKRKGLTAKAEPCVASIDAAGVGWGSCLWLDVAGAFCPGPAGCGDEGRGGLVFVCAGRGGPPSLSLRRAGAPQLHQADYRAVLGLEPSFGIARWQASAASIDAINSPVRGLRPLRLLWLSSGRCRGAQAAPPRKSAMPASAKPGWIRFRRASLRLGGEELRRAAEEGCALRRLAEGGPQEAQRASGRGRGRAWRL